MRQLQEISSLSQAEITILEELKAIIERFIPNATVILYGSTTGGARTAESDYDILVIMPTALGSKDEDRIQDAVYDLELAHRVVLSLIFMSIEEWNSPLSKVSPYHRNIERGSAIMRPEELEYIRHRLLRSQEALEEAELLLKNSHFFGTVNRLYYACFYAVTALLYSEGLSSSTHNGVRTLFGEHWIKTSRFPKEMGTFYRRLFERRQKGDYTDSITFGRQEVEAWLAETKAFVEHIRYWLDKYILK